MNHISLAGSWGYSMLFFVTGGVFRLVKKKKHCFGHLGFHLFAGFWGKFPGKFVCFLLLHAFGRFFFCASFWKMFVDAVLSHFSWEWGISEKKKRPSRR